jgi:hypothetical protein
MELRFSQAAFSAYACIWRGSTREMGMNALSARHSTPVTTLAPQLHHHTTPQNTTESIRGLSILLVPADRPVLPRLSAERSEGCLDDPRCRSLGLKPMAERTRNTKAKCQTGKNNPFICNEADRHGEIWIVCGCSAVTALHCFPPKSWSVHLRSSGFRAKSGPGKCTALRWHVLQTGEDWGWNV